MDIVNIPQPLRPQVGAFFVETPSSELPLEILASNVQELKDLCQNLDPYNPLSETDKEILKKYHIYDFFDPFTLTNKLILALEDALEEWHRRTQTPLD